MEETGGTIYTSKELKILKTCKKINVLKVFKYIYLIFSFIFVFIAISDIYKIVTNLEGNVLIIFFAIIIDLIFMLLSFNRFCVYHILLQKLKIINNVENNSLVDTCNEKIKRCKMLIENNESYYTVQKHYNDLREFLEDYKALLPVEIYIRAKKDLDTIASELINCN